MASRKKPNADTALIMSPTTEDMDLIRRIVDRASGYSPSPLSDADRLDLSMDIIAVHLNDQALDLAAMVDESKGRRFDFVHHINGISRHLDRETGKLRDCFSPRYSLRGHRGPAKGRA